MGGIDLTATSVSKEQKVTLQVKPKDILVFVPGTTDPPNATAAQHQANQKYWEENKLLFEAIKELKKQYLDLHIQDEFFSWSGDNDQKERAKAGNRLRLLLYARENKPVYQGWINLPVALHLVGHSHGGNVINEFTKAIKEHGDFPKRWTIKSITYLSTPFFNKLHQLDKTHLHPECRILNVFNHFDITQRAIADYSLHQLPPVLELVKEDPSVKGLKKVFGDFNTSVLARLKSSDAIDDQTDGPELWRTTVTLMTDLAKNLDGVSKLVTALTVKHGLFSPTGQTALTTFIAGLRRWAIGAAALYQTRLNDRTEITWREDRYSTLTFLSDFNLTALATAIADFLRIDEATLNGPLLDVVDDILAKRIDVVDDTKATPKAQVPSNLEITPIPVRTYDKYNGMLDGAYGTFISSLEKESKSVAATNSSRDRRAVVLRLLAQLDYGVLRSVANGIDWAETVVTGNLDAACKRIRAAIEGYLRLLDARNAHMSAASDFVAGLLAKQMGDGLGGKTIADVREELEDDYPQDPRFLHFFNEFVRNERLRDTQSAAVALGRLFLKRDRYAPYWKEMNDFPLDHQRGSIAYLAVFSHSISRSAFYDEVRAALTPAFVSGKNPGYAVKKK